MVPALGAEGDMTSYRAPNVRDVLRQLQAIDAKCNIHDPHAASSRQFADTRVSALHRQSQPQSSRAHEAWKTIASNTQNSL